MPQLKIGPFYLGKPDADDREAVESASRVCVPIQPPRVPPFPASRCIAACSPAHCSLPFNFPHVGVTRTAPPLPEDVAAEGWTVDHNRVMVRAVLTQRCSAVMLNLAPGLTPCPSRLMLLDAAGRAGPGGVRQSPAPAGGVAAL